ncbi:MAG: thermostable hemolysin [Hyphomicrobiales bacterium]
MPNDGLTCIVGANDNRRAAAERFVANAYRREFATHPGTHYPELLCHWSRNGTLRAACGLRHASGGPLFLEQYLDAPVEAALSEAFGMPVLRRSIVEIGSLASEEPAALFELVGAAAELIVARRGLYGVVTATGSVQRLFRQLSLPTETLGPARPERLPDGGRGWGTYYQHSPMVLAGFMPDCIMALWSRRPRTRLVPLYTALAAV